MLKKKRNPNDGTTRNVQAANKRFAKIEARLKLLEDFAKMLIRTGKA